MDLAPPVARPAATIILCRPLPDAAGFEVLLVKRHGKSGFMAGAHVFPGGRVEEADAVDAAHLGLACSALLDGLDPVTATGFCVAALRETLEESNVRLSGVDALAPWSWWVTPEAEPKRFDTRFFLAEVPAGTVATVDAHEAIDALWATPTNALAAYARGDIVLAPPTLCTLEDLAPFRSVDAARRAVDRPVPRVCPKLLSGDALVLALPGDALHDDPTRAFANRTRVVMTPQGRFASAEAPGKPAP